MAGGTTFTYTPFNLAQTATTGGIRTTYRYDADHQRRTRVEEDGTTTVFVAGPTREPLAEYRRTPAGLMLLREYVSLGDRLLASIEPTTTVSWGEPIVAGETFIKAEHLAELRREVNAVRGLYGLAAATWQVDPGETADALRGRFVDHRHVNELRAALTAIAPHDFGADLAAGEPILAAHFTAIRERVNALRAGGARYYHLDALGSVRVVTGSSGVPRRRHDYLPFGEEYQPEPGAGDARQFTGKERDSETGMDYFGARQYMNGTGRFNSVDPLMNIDEALGDPQQWNRYTYVLNRPENMADPDGRGPIRVSDRWSQQVADLKREYEQASGLKKVWLHLRLGWELGSILPTPSAIALEGAALAPFRGCARRIGAGFHWPAGARILEGQAVGVAFRKPDLFSQLANAFGEVKNAAFLARTAQLRDYIEYAGKTGMQLNLFLRTDTKLTAPLIRGLNQLGNFRVFRYINGEWVNVTSEYLISKK